MATLPTRSFQTIVQNTIAGIQGRARELIDFSKGSPLRAIAEGFAGLFLWFQAMILQVLTAMRLATATGSDVDTFTGDFQVYRLGAQASTGLVIFTRFTAGPSSCFIPVGATVQSADGSQSFQVVADTSFVTFSSQLNGYTLVANVAAIIVPVQAATPGANGNAAAATVTVMTSVIPGIDVVTNPAAFTNGFDAEPDPNLKTRFQAFILGLSRGDFFGTEYAVLSVSINVQWDLVENSDYAGNFAPGTYFVVADDGSGFPSATFMAAMAKAVDSVRPLGNMASTFPPIVNNIVISMQIQTAPGYDHNTVCGLVAVMVQNSVNALGLAQGLPFSIISSWAYLVAGVTSVTGELLNGLSGDGASIAADPKTTIKCNSCIVS